MLVFVVLSAIAGRAAAQGAPPRLRVSGNPGLLNITTAVPGSPPTPVSDATTTYDVRVNASSVKKITAQLNAPLPAGVTLRLTMGTPAGATNLGPVDLDATEQDVITNITSVNATYGVTYQLNATTPAGVVAASSRSVVLRLVDTP